MSLEAPDTAELIHLVRREGDAAQIRFGGCETVVTLSASTDALGVTVVAQSHWVRTPEGDRARKPRLFVGVSPRRALGSTIGELATRFQHGLEEGHAPDESWFVPIPEALGGATWPTAKRRSTPRNGSPSDPGSTPTGPAPSQPIA